VTRPPDAGKPRGDPPGRAYLLTNEDKSHPATAGPRAVLTNQVGPASMRSSCQAYGIITMSLPTWRGRRCAASGELALHVVGGRGAMVEEARTRKILVVDDEEAVRSLCIACIQHGLGDDYEVFEAADGDEAFAAVETDRPDLILLDILMPEVDGFEVCRRLKESPETRDIPIVFLTALGEEKDVQRGLALGGDGYIVKPFNAVTLAAQISEILTPNCDC